MELQRRGPRRAESLLMTRDGEGQQTHAAAEPFFKKSRRE
jgi:hypothetical protein